MSEEPVTQSAVRVWLKSCAGSVTNANGTNIVYKQDEALIMMHDRVVASIPKDNIAVIEHLVIDEDRNIIEPTL